MVAASAGNHAQGVALAAQMLGIQATVFMPEGAPIPKEKATRGYGADVVFHGRYLEDALVARPAVRRRDRGGADPPLRPRRHRGRAGHRPGWRSSSRRPTSRPCWCRPAAAGCWPGSRSRSRPQRPDVRVVGVQAEGAAAYPASLAQGSPQPLDVDADDGRRHRGRAARRRHLRRGPRPRRRDRHGLGGVAVAGAAGAAGAGQDGRRAGRARPRSRRCSTSRTAYGTPTVAVLSGGNIDPLLLGKVIRHGMAAAGRYLYLRVCIPDRPRRPGPAARRARRGGRQHPRGRPRADLAELAPRRGRGAAADGDPRRAARRAGHRPAARVRLPRLRVTGAAVRRTDRAPVSRTSARSACCGQPDRPVDGLSR